MPLLELADRALEDDVGHLRQVRQRLVAVDPPLEVDLPDRRQPGVLEDVDEQADLDGVAGEERQRLEQRPPAGVLPGQRLDDARQLGEEEVDERPCHQLGDAPAALRLQGVALADRPLVEALHVLELRLDEQRAEQAVDEARLDVADVGVDPGDDVPVEHVEALPERLALAAEGAELGQDLGVAVDRHAQLLGDLDGAVGAVRVDDHDLVDERHLVHQRAPHALDDRPDRPLLVQRRQPDADREVLPLLERHELADVGELVGMERVLGEPLVDDDRQRAGALDEGVGVGERPLAGAQLLERGEADRLLASLRR